MAAGKTDDHSPQVRVFQLNATYEAFGMVVDYVARRLPFAGFEAGILAEALFQQLKRGHHLIATRNDKVVGYAGWLLTTPEIANAWASGLGTLVRKEGPEATAAALTIVASEERVVTTKLIRGARTLNPGKRAYFKRSESERRSSRKQSVRI